MRSARSCRVILAACQVVACALLHAADQPDGDVDALVAQLGDADYAVRETAASSLAALGSAAADALLTAAETNPDIEIALRARWLIRDLPAESLALSRPDDPPAVAALLDRLARAPAANRGAILHRVLRLDDDAGIEPLARIVRLDRTAAGSRTAAVLLIDEWQPGDPAWAAIRERIARGLGTSGRPTATFLRGLVEFTRSESPAAREQAVAATTAAFARLDAALPGDTAGERIDGVLRRTFRRGLIRMLIAANRKDEALAEADRLLVAGGRPEADESVTVTELAWLTDNGLPEAVKLVEQRWPQLVQSNAVAKYAAALSWRRLGDEPAARQRAAAAFELTQAADDAAERRAAIARLLAKWGASDWASREYESVVASATTPDETFAVAALMFSEFLYDQDDHARAADVLRQLVTRSEADGGDLVRRTLSRDVESIRSRMLYFESCAAAARGDAAGRRRLVEEAVAAYPKDVEALIALYHLPDNTPAQRAEVAGRVARAAEQIDSEIQAVPEESQGYNEYAWLVSNTEGDVEKATRYSRMSLDKSPDEASFLDTLAHCHAASGRMAAAVRTQSLAHRQEPHGRTILRNLERFRSQLPTP
jgi:hypothetical protein